MAGESKIREFTGGLTVRDAQDGVNSLKAMLADDIHEIELAADVSVDACGLQSLISAHKSAARNGRPLRVRAPEGSALHAAMSRAGLLDALDVRPVFDGDDWVGLEAIS